jgi:hypothetical protein
MWGYNPTCNIVVIDDKDRYFNYTSGSIGGCGYDKKSTSVAEALNASPTIQKLFCEKGENVTSYGFRRKSDYSLPYLEGGVGCECYSRVFEIELYVPFWADRIASVDLEGMDWRETLV